MDVAAAGEGKAESDAVMWIKSPGNTETEHKSSNIMPENSFVQSSLYFIFPLSFIAILYSPSTFIFFTLLVFPPWLLLVAVNQDNS